MIKNLTDRICFSVCLICVISLSVSAQTKGNDRPAETAETPQQKQLKIGLVLSGGGARGMAHVGVIEWFEKNRIPVDYLTGTSMGGLVGAVYAMGMRPEEMRPFLKSLNWDELLSNGPGFKQLAFRRKEDKRAFQAGFELGYRNGLALPLGASTAHYIGLLIDRLTLPYSDIASFDQLPIPYRCVATDFINAKPLVLKDGSLSSAMRATMSIPGVFPPIERNGIALVDGALLNNIPTDVMKEFGPDVIIAVDVGTPLGDLKAITSLVGILTQSVGVMTIENDRRNLRLADIIIAPELGELSLLDFSAVDKVADIGYQAAEAKAAILTKFSLSEEEWSKYLAARRVKQRTKIPAADNLVITGVDERAKNALYEDFSEYLGKPLDIPKFEAALTEITGQGRYRSLDYKFRPAPGDLDSYTLEIRAHEKAYAPPTINIGVEVDGSDVNAINFTVGTRVTFYGVGSYGSEWRNDVKVGFGNLFQTEYFRPIGESGLFIAPRAAYRRERQGLYTGSRRLLEYEADRYGVGFDVGILSKNNELRAGYELSRVNARTSTGITDVPTIDGNLSVARLRYTYDGQDSWTVPRRGLRITTEGRLYFAAPNAKQNFQQLDLRGSYFAPLTGRGSIFGALSAATSFKQEITPIQQFLLGGPFRFGAYNRDELRVNHYALGTVGYLHKLYQLPSLVGSAVYAGGWFDQLWTSGGFTSTFDPQRFRVAGSAGVVMDTKLGPFSIIGSFGEGGRGKIYFALGKFF